MTFNKNTVNMFQIVFEENIEFILLHHCISMLYEPFRPMKILLLKCLLRPHLLLNPEVELLICIFYLAVYFVILYQNILSFLLS